MQSIPSPDILMPAMAMMGPSSLQLNELSRALPKVVKTLKKLDKASTVSALAGLLTVPSFQCATIRLEVLIHLAVIHCNSTKEIEANQVEQLLNNTLEAVGVLEDPAEDVFVSNVVSWDGNTRIFEGIWEGNDAYLQYFLDALNGLEPAELREPINAIRAILKLSEKSADRANLHRFNLTESMPRRAHKIRSQDLRRSSQRVRFSEAQLNVRCP